MVERRGDQEPTFSVIGDYDHTDGADCIEMFESYGSFFIPAQKTEMSIYLARNEDGSAAFKSVGTSAPRQNGKSYDARHYSCWEAAVEDKKVLYSAHHGKTTRKFARMIFDIFESKERYRDFYESVDYVCHSQGDEGVYLKNGGCIEFMTRTTAGPRSNTYDVIVVDEAQELTDAQQDAMVPTISAGDMGDPQVIYIGTPPGPECSGTVFSEMHRRAHSDEPGGIAWLEWSADDMPAADTPRDELLELAYKTNPMMGYRITEDAVLNEIDTMSRDGLARERLGWWSDLGEVKSVISEREWESCKVESPTADGYVCYGIKFHPDGSHVAICAAVKGEPTHVELVDIRSTSHGTGWIAYWLDSIRDNTAAVAIDGRSGSEALIQRLNDIGYPRKAILVPKMGDVVAASTSMLEAVRSHAITHIEQQALDASATGSIRRNIGNNGGWGFGEGTSDSLAIEAASLALWASATTKRDPSRKMRVL